MGRPRRHFYGRMDARFEVYGNEGGCGGNIRRLWIRVDGKFIGVGEICDRCGGTHVDRESLHTVWRRGCQRT